MTDNTLKQILDQLKLLTEAINAKPQKVPRSNTQKTRFYQVPDGFIQSLDEFIKNNQVQFYKGITTQEILYGINSPDSSLSARRAAASYLKSLGFNQSQFFRNKKRALYWLKPLEGLGNKTPIKAFKSPIMDEIIKVKPAIVAPSAPKPAEPIKYRDPKLMLAEWIKSAPIVAYAGVPEQELLNYLKTGGMTNANFTVSLNGTGMLRFFTPEGRNGRKPGFYWAYQPRSSGAEKTQHLPGLNEAQLKQLRLDAELEADDLY